MIIRTGAYPDPTLDGVGASFFSVWRVGTAERQRAAVDAVTRAWESRPRPTEGLLGYHLFAGTDGDELLHYTQWADVDSHAGFVGRWQRQERVDEIDAAVPGIERPGLTRTRRYRSGGPAEGDDRTPGCVVLVDVEFEGPDEGRQRAWVDAVFDALADDPAPHPGGISAHFHLSIDGRRVLNYAEWESERAHREALAAPGDGVGSRTPLWERVQRFPGLRGSTVRRYRPVRSLIPG